MDLVVGTQPNGHPPLNVVTSAVGRGSQVRSFLSESSVLQGVRFVTIFMLFSKEFSGCGGQVFY